MGFCMHTEGVECDNCRVAKFNPRWMTQPIRVQPIGWTCPNCGTVNNPSLPACFGCRPTNPSDKENSK